MFDVDDLKTPTGFTVEDIANEARMMFLKICCADDREPSEAAKENWKTAAEIAVEHCLREVEVPWKTLTERVVNAYYHGHEYENLKPIMQLIWEATTRHAVNVITAQDREDLNSMGNFDWKKWVASKMQSHEEAHAHV